MRLLTLPVLSGSLLVFGGLLFLLGLWETGRYLTGPAAHEFVGPGPVEMTPTESGRHTLWLRGNATTPAPHPATVRATLTDRQGDRQSLASLSSIERRSVGSGYRVKVGHFLVRGPGAQTLAIEQPTDAFRYALEPTRLDDHATRAFLGLFFGGVLVVFAGGWLLVSRRRG